MSDLDERAAPIRRVSVLVICWRTGIPGDSSLWKCWNEPALLNTHGLCSVSLSEHGQIQNLRNSN